MASPPHKGALAQSGSAGACRAQGRRFESGMLRRKEFMKASNIKKNEQLKIPFGTAMGRLRKNIMFDLVQKCGRDICIRCGQKIESVDVFSIDHLEPWLDYPENDNERFWNLDNIGFSHERCNTPHRIPGPVGNSWSRKVGPEGTLWCRGCQDFVVIEKIVKNASKWNGYDTECLGCKRKRF